MIPTLSKLSTGTCLTNFTTLLLMAKTNVMGTWALDSVPCPRFFFFPELVEMRPNFGRIFYNAQNDLLSTNQTVKVHPDLRVGMKRNWQNLTCKHRKFTSFDGCNVVCIHYIASVDVIKIFRQKIIDIID